MVRTTWLAMLMLMWAGSALAQQAPQSPVPADARAVLRASRPRAIQQVLASVKGENPIWRANAIEAAQHMPERLLPLVQLAMDDSDPAVRYAALVTVGQLKIAPLAGVARRLRNDKTRTVQAAALFALHQLGEEVNLSPLFPMLISDKPGLRANVAMLLGMIGEVSAVPMLVEAAQLPLNRVSPEVSAIVRLQMSEAVVTLLDHSNNTFAREAREDALMTLRAAVFSQSFEVAVLSVTMLGRLGDVQMRVPIETIFEPDDPRDMAPIELRLAAAEYTARIGRPRGLEVVLKATSSRITPVRAQAALTLGLFDQPRAAQRLTALLDDTQEMVRLSAAASILRTLGESTKAAAATNTLPDDASLPKVPSSNVR